MITDLAMNFDDLSELEKPSNNDSHLSHSFALSSKEMWISLVSLAIIMPLCSVTFSYCLDNFLSDVLLYLINQQSFTCFIATVFISLAFSLTGTTICSYFKDSEGTGIPELKTILSGINVPNFLSLRILFAKIFSLFLTIGSGLFIGIEGPFVHISAAIAENITRLRFFHHLQRKITFKRQLLAAAGGIGITSTFGTPIGGCIYSIETMSVYFAISAFWKTFFCSVICGVVFHLYGSVLGLPGWILTKFPAMNYEIDFEIFAFLILGLVCGIFGAMHVKFIEFLLIYGANFKRKMGIFRYLYTGTCSFLSIFILYYSSPLGLMQKRDIEIFFTSKVDPAIDHWWKLMILSFLKLLSNGLAVTCPLPTGVFIPLLFTGSVVGRVFGLIMSDIFPGVQDIGRYSVVGAAALVTGVTHTLAMAVITLELTGQMVLLFPVLVGVVSACFISKTLTISIYYAIANVKNLPFLPKLLKPELYRKTAKDIMQKNFSFIFEKADMGDLLKFLWIKRRNFVIPILDDSNYHHLKATILLENLKNYLFHEAKIYKKQRFHHQNVLSPLNHININKSENHTNYNFPKPIKQLKEISKEDSFWKKTVDFSSPLINLDYNPFTIPEDLSVAKLHVLFSMLGLQNVCVTYHNGQEVTGLISVNDFDRKE